MIYCTSRSITQGKKAGLISLLGVGLWLSLPHHPGIIRINSRAVCRSVCLYGIENSRGDLPVIRLGGG